jgi:flagellar basal body-associated protein FliL
MSKVMSILGIVSRVLIIIVLLVVTVLSLGTAYIMFAPDELPKPFRLAYNFDPIPTSGPEPTAAPSVLVPPGQGIIVTTSAKIINLSGTNGTKLIRVTVSLEFNPPDAKYADMKTEEKAAYLATFNTDIATKLPIIDDVIITNISTKTFDALYTAAGKESLRQELQAALNARLADSGQKIISVYFTEFVIN